MVWRPDAERQHQCHSLTVRKTAVPVVSALYHAREGSAVRMVGNAERRGAGLLEALARKGVECQPLARSSCRLRSQTVFS